MAEMIVSDLKEALWVVTELHRFFNIYTDTLQQLRARWERFQFQTTETGTRGFRYTMSMRISMCAFFLSILKSTLEKKIEDVGELALDLDGYIVVPETDDAGNAVDEDLFFEYIEADPQLSEYSRFYSAALTTTLEVGDELDRPNDWDDIVLNQQGYTVKLDGLNRNC